MSNWMAVATLASAGLNAYGQYQQGVAERDAAYATAAQQDAQANQERAIAQIERARQARIHKSQNSQQKSLLAASGFAADDPTALNLVSETVGAQTLEELLTLAQGEEAAQAMDFSATQSRRAGKNAYSSGVTGAIGTLVGSGLSWRDRYGSGSSGASGGSAGKKPRPSGRVGNRKLAQAG